MISNKYLNGLICVASFIVICFSFSIKGLSPTEVTSYCVIVLLIAAIYFLQNQTYSYLIPRHLKEEINDSKPIKFKRFFSGGVDFGYVFVLLHMPTLFTQDIASGVFLYVGLMLILFGTISRVKETLEIFLTDYSDAKTN